MRLSHCTLGLLLLLLSRTVAAQDIGSLPSSWQPTSPSAAPEAQPIEREVAFATEQGRLAQLEAMSEADRLTMRDHLTRATELRVGGAASLIAAAGLFVLGGASLAGYVHSCEAETVLLFVVVVTNVDCNETFLIPSLAGFGLGAASLAMGIALFPAAGRQEQRAREMFDLKLLPSRDGVSLALSGTFG